MKIDLDKGRHRQAQKTLPEPRMWINGPAQRNGSQGTFEHVDAATGDIQAEIPLGGSVEVDLAVKAAREGFRVWSAMRPAQRRDAMERHAVLISANLERFADIATLENGMPRSGFLGGMSGRIIDWCKYYAGWADKVEGQVVSTNPSGHFEFTRPEPYGVIGHIITWNAPLLSLAMKVPPSLAAGNAVVIKPAEFTPFSAMLYCELAREAGIPDGVINVVIGGANAGAALVAHDGVDKISFTGGPLAARNIMENASRTLKPVLFELGGKSANLVFDDVDMEETAAYCAAFAVSNCGQGCALPTRLLVKDSIYDEMVERVKTVLSSLAIGDPLHQDTYIGPLVNEAACNRVTGMIETARNQGAGRLVMGGSRLGGQFATGYFVEPTLFVDVDPESTIAQQEVFGPVLSMIRFKSEEEAVKIANATLYGLSAYVQTHDLDRAHRLVAQLNAGTVYVNRAQPSLCAAAPFGGVGISGFGREGGKAGLDEFVRIKGVGISIMST